ncbi:Mur ligase family protein [Lacipirellula sp.]|uniref:Mur ligase family protein n=1 Tax=Lacipirellula sp. TaxID=2691419 RepID=UPI003D0F1145
MSQEQAIGVALDHLFSGACRTGAKGASVTSCTSDWRRVQPGDAFVAVLTADNDGHDFADRAVKRGAAAIIVERPIPVHSVPVYHVEDTRVALGELCHALVDNPSQRMRVIAVVGDQGKAATVALLESIYVAAGYEVGVLSTIKSFDGMTRSEGIDDEITPSVLAARLARMESAGCSHALLEVTSQSLAQMKLAGIELDTVVATTVDSARLDLHHTVKNYRDAQRRVLDYLSPTGLTIVNADDAVSCRWLSQVGGPALTYGLGDEAQINGIIVEENACETVFILGAGTDSAAVRTSIVGRQQVTNCLAAAAVALAHGVEFQTIAQGIESVKKLPARMERVDCGQDFPVFIDAAHTASGLRATLRAARALATGRVICVMGENVQATAEESETIRSVLRKMADVTIVTDAVTELDEAWLTEHSAAPKSEKLQIAADRQEAIAWAVAMAGQGDVVVLAGSRTPTDFTFGGAQISDTDVAREVLYAAARPMLRLVG